MAFSHPPSLSFPLPTRAAGWGSFRGLLLRLGYRDSGIRILALVFRCGGEEGSEADGIELSCQSLEW
ncbi:hypothetical protein OPV22_030532 [Ensete ventricosum]|uniref:Uncharacterized protein n=1 Tax=Ensete ventricosum TaxID=4639 RepID=A0AAV8Q9B1_ENSVE|nr:hypothetical protein OPV22_030532 [Ensete ventricosum]